MNGTWQRPSNSNSQWKPGPTEGAEEFFTKLLHVLLILFLGCLIAYTSYLNFTKLSPWAMDSDIANDISFRRESWEQKSLFPEGFVGPHYPLAKRAVLIYWFFYAITKNYLLAYQLENFATFLLMLGVLYFLMEKLEINRTVRLLSLCMLVIFLPVDIKMCVFYPANYSITLVIVVLLTLAFRIELYKNFEGIATMKEKCVKRPLALVCFLAALYGFMTIKLAMVLYLPLFCLDVLRLLFDFINRRSTGRKKLFMLFVSGVTLGLNLIFYILLIKFHGDSFNRPVFWIGNIHEWLEWDVLSAQINAVLQSLGISGGGSLTSITGVRFLLSSCVLVIEIISIIWLFQKSKKADPQKESGELIFYWVITTIAIFLMEVITLTKEPVPRYYFVTAILLPVICGAAITDWVKRGNNQIILWPIAAIALCMGMFFATSIKQDSIRFSAEPPELSKVATYIKDNGYKYVTGSFWNAGVITGYTNGAVDYQHSGDITYMDPFRWLIDVRKFDQEKSGEPNILLLTDSEEEGIIDKHSFPYLMLREYSEKVAEIGSYNLYALTENPYTLVKKVELEYTAGLPDANQSKKIDYPSNVGLIYQGASLNEQRELVSNGNSEGYIMYGPYSESVSGIYNITLNYVVDVCPKEATGVFDVALDMQSLAAISFAREATSVTLENVDIEGGHSFEVRVWVSEGMIIRVQSIEYERIN